jgi:hypothetical protein
LLYRYKNKYYDSTKNLISLISHSKTDSTIKGNRAIKIVIKVSFTVNIKVGVCGSVGDEKWKLPP